MKTEEILEGNKLIAEFMGGKYKFDKFQVADGFIWIPVHCLCKISLLKFNSSWDWLMPVVEKIETEILDGETSVLIDGDNCHIRSSGFSRGVFGITKIESVFLACIQFIKWYNQNK